MIKAIVDSVSVSNGEVTKFSVIDERRGVVGSFQMFESDESKYGQYKVGDEFSLNLYHKNLVIPEYTKDFFSPTPAPTVDTTPGLDAPTV